MQTPRPSARDVIDALLDLGSWRGWDTPAAHETRDPAYAADLAAAVAASGADEAVLTGEGTLRGRRVALVVSEFGFLAGSMGHVASQRVVAAFDRARRERIPVIAAPASGGTRMQEGTPAFVRMVSIAAAVAEFKRAGLPYLVYLRHPTLGGVFASWASLGHVTLAEPGALVGFLGPRVYEALYAESFPTGVQRAENLHERGLIDVVAPLHAATGILDAALRVLWDGAGAAAAAAEPPSRRAATDPPTASDAWDSILRTRSMARPGVLDLLEFGAEETMLLRGSGQGEHDPALLLALARFDGQPVVLLGQSRRRDSVDEPLGPEGLRVARRGMRLAADLGLPLVSVVDTSGAALSKEAEEGGMAGEIARCLADLVMLESPTLCVLLGQGTGGGALALLPADRVVASAHSWLSPLPPEGASAILYRSVDRAPQMAARQRVSAGDLLADGIVDLVIPECPDAAAEPDAFCRRVASVIGREVAELRDQPPPARVSARLQRYRDLAAR